MAFQGNAEIQKLVDHSNPGNANIETYTTDLLREQFKKDFPDHLEQLNTIVKDFIPGLVVNRVRSKKDLLTGDNLLKLVKKFLGVKKIELKIILN